MELFACRIASSNLPLWASKFLWAHQLEHVPEKFWTIAEEMKADRQWKFFKYEPLPVPQEMSRGFPDLQTPLKT